MAMSSIGVALVGGGIFAKEQHLPAIQASPLLELKAIYSRSLSSAKSAAALHTTSVDLYSDDSGAGKTYHDLLLREDVSAVIIALPIVSQPEYIEAALAAGKHVLSEKPLAKDVATGQKLIAFCKRAQQDGKKRGLFGVAENYRYKPQLAYAAEQVAKLGKVTHFNVKVMRWMKPESKYYKTAWRAKPEHQGGFLLDSGVHEAAAVRLMLGGGVKAKAVCAFTELVQENLPPIDTINAIVRLSSGASGVLQLSAGSAMNATELHFACERGAVKVDGGGTVTVKPIDGEPSEKTFEWVSAVKEEVQAWAEGIQRGSLDAAQSAEEALADLEFLEQMFRSGEEGGAQKMYEHQ